nr:MAG TPA: hypothetical protein [Caudoviricetes sp.]
MPTRQRKRRTHSTVSCFCSRCVTFAPRTV